MSRSLRAIRAAAFLGGTLGAAQILAAPVVAVLPIQNRAGDRAAAEAVQQAVRSELDGYTALVDRGRTRAVQRRMRIRDSMAADSASLRRLASELGADWLIAPVLHDAERRGVPRMTLSARLFEGPTGELVWIGFHGGSGLDRRTVLGLKEIDDAEQLARPVVERVVDGLAQRIAPQGDGSDRGSRSPGPGRVAIVPFDATTKKRRTANAETMTEVAHTVLHRRDFELVSPGCVRDVLKRRQAGQWGGVVPASREDLQLLCGADLILTGSVEVYEDSSGAGGPNPRVAVALRLVDPVSGRILWTDGVERTAQQMQGLFRSGRLYSRGALAERLMEMLVRRLLKKWPFETAERKETG